MTYSDEQIREWNPDDSVRADPPLGEYSLVRNLAKDGHVEGGHAEAWLAKGETGKHVILKVPLTSLWFGENSDAYRRRFTEEILSLAKLAHPNIVSFLGCGVDDRERMFHVCEYLPGRSLRTRIDASLDGKEPIDLDSLRTWGSGLLSGLSHAHSSKAGQICHRDLTPNNVILLDDRPPDPVKLIDFGLAIVLEEWRVSATTPLRWGTDFYRPPEAATAAAGAVDWARWDVWQAGRILYEIAAIPGYLALRTDAKQYSQHINKQVFERTPIICWNSAVSSAVSNVILRATASAPGDRYASATEFLQAWTAAWATITGPLPPIPIDPDPPPPRPNRFAAIAAAGVVVIAAGAFLFSIIEPRPDAGNTSPADSGSISAKLAAVNTESTKSPATVPPRAVVPGSSLALPTATGAESGPPPAWAAPPQHLTAQPMVTEFAPTVVPNWVSSRPNGTIVYDARARLGINCGVAPMLTASGSWGGVEDINCNSSGWTTLHVQELDIAGHTAPGRVYCVIFSAPTDRLSSSGPSSAREVDTVAFRYTRSPMGTIAIRNLESGLAASRACSGVEGATQ